MLHEWDQRRSAAWAAGDATALGGLYTADSTAGTADVTLMLRYADHGLRVHEMRMQVLSARTLITRPRLLELEVTDRLASAVAVRSGDRLTLGRLPSDTATTRRLVLRRVDGRWLMARVWAVPSPGTGGR